MNATIYRTTTKEEFFHPIMSHIMPIMACRNHMGIVGGTAILVAPHFAITAKHVIEYICRECNISLSKQKEVVLDIYLHQMVTGCVWYVSQIFAWVGTDIAFLRLHPRNDEAKRYAPKRLPITIDPPPVASEITALGYPSSKIQVLKNDGEATEIKLELTPTVSTGRVMEVYSSCRDSAMLRFPCFTVDTRFASGMSGGAVFNDKKELCGLVCSGLEEDGVQDGFFYSNAVSIWPSMIIPINLKLDDCMPDGLEAGRIYKVLDLARSGYFDVRGHERIEFFKHKNGSDGVRRKHY